MREQTLILQGHGSTGQLGRSGAKGAAGKSLEIGRVWSSKCQRLVSFCGGEHL